MTTWLTALLPTGWCQVINSFHVPLLFTRIKCPRFWYKLHFIRCRIQPTNILFTILAHILTRHCPAVSPLCKLTLRVRVKALLASSVLVSGRACTVLSSLIFQWLEEFVNKVWASRLFSSWLNLCADIRAYFLFLPVSALVSCAFWGVHFIQVIKVTGIKSPVTSLCNWKSRLLAAQKPGGQVGGKES